MREQVTARQLEPVVRAAYGTRRRLVSVSRLRGGTRKGVYRLRLDDGSTVVLYLWAAAENYWPDETSRADPLDPGNPFAAAEGVEVFLANQRLLASVGVGTPEVVLTDPDHRLHPDDLALVSDAPAGRLEELLVDDPAAAGAVLRELGVALRAMGAHRAPGFGKVGLVDGGYRDPRPAEQVVFERALRTLAESAARVPAIAAVADRLTDVLSARHAAISPRAEFALVHGELGPDHVLLDRQGRPVLIDIESLMYFDVEWEHVFLRIRFGDRYPELDPVELDPARTALYSLAQYLSLVAGPLRLLDGDFPERAAMQQIADINTSRVLAAVR